MTTSSAIRVRLFGETDILSDNNITLIMSTAMRMSCDNPIRSQTNKLAAEHTVDASLVFEISNEGRVRERSEGSREASPSYAPSSLRPIQQPAGEQTEQVDAEAETEEPEASSTSLTMPLPHIRLPNRQFDITDAPGRKFSDLSLYKFFYLNPTGNFIFFLFFAVVFSAVLAEMMPGMASFLGYGEDA